MSRSHPSGSQSRTSSEKGRFCRFCPTVINVMRLKGTLEQYLSDLNRDAQETYDLLIRQYAEIEGVTEELKSSDEMEYTRRMNSIRNRVEEFVLSDFVYA